MQDGSGAQNAAIPGPGGLGKQKPGAVIQVRCVMTATNIGNQGMHFKFSDDTCYLQNIDNCNANGSFPRDEQSAVRRRRSVGASEWHRNGGQKGEEFASKAGRYSLRHHGRHEYRADRWNHLQRNSWIETEMRICVFLLLNLKHAAGTSSTLGSLS